VGRIRRWLNANMPTQDSMRQNRWLAPFADRILRSELWRFTQRSVPRGVALGMLTAFMVPIGQVFAATFLALPARANVPIAALVTFVTNPFVYPFWVVVANKVGGWVVRFDFLLLSNSIERRIEGELGEWLSWFMREAAVTAFGFAIIGIVGAALGYLMAAWGWRWWIGHKWRKRKLERADP